MNERMQQLADQAEKYADNNFKGEPGYSEAYDSKFAELIVRECLNVLYANGLYEYDISEVLCDHFGVEQ